ncbi:uncharacterized protein LOC131209896 [Anopheles bellator]|uniref:uncharacterized protein LOC131209896 n=1 Tax=Anopheles bellator TaxID=139047 RepID=UPI002649E540|nr:uncharacterized protein LOC131209896 [Anopheles bellator]
MSQQTRKVVKRQPVAASVRCSFCLSKSNIFSLFPLDQFPHPYPHYLVHFIDSYFGFGLSPESDKDFQLCKKCIKTMECFVAFRNKCRRNYYQQHVRRSMCKPKVPVEVQETLPSSSHLSSTEVANQPHNVMVKLEPTDDCVAASDRPGTSKMKCSLQFLLTGASEHAQSSRLLNGNKGVKRRSATVQKKDAKKPALQQKVIDNWKKGAKHIRVIMNRTRPSDENMPYVEEKPTPLKLLNPAAACNNGCDSGPSKLSNIALKSNRNENVNPCIRSCVVKIEKLNIRKFGYIC